MTPESKIVIICINTILYFRRFNLMERKEDINGISCKTSNRLRKDKVDFPFFAIAHHTHKIRSFFSHYTRNAFICVNVNESPPGILCNCVGIICNLCFVTFKLIFAIGTYAAISGNTQQTFIVILLRKNWIGVDLRYNSSRLCLHCLPPYCLF